MRRFLLALAFVLFPALSSAQFVPGSPFGGSSGGGDGVGTDFGIRAVICPAKILSTTSATAETFASVTSTSALGGTAMVYATVVASDGTLSNVDSLVATGIWRNNAGTATAAFGVTAAAASLDASGTLTVPLSTSATGNVVSLVVTPSWVTIVPTSVTGYFILFVNSPDEVTCS